jgi:hypothetical protein
MIKRVQELISTDLQITLLMMEEELKISKDNLQNLNGRSWKTEDLR